MIRILVLLIAVLTLVGCAPKVQTITTTVYRNVTMDDAWLVDCATVTPPDTVEYNAASLKSRSDMWARKYLDQAGVNGDCNIRLKEARDFNARMKAATSTVVCTDGVCN